MGTAHTGVSTAATTAVRSKIVVQWTPPPRTCACPRCGTHDTRTVSTSGGHRYHTCRGCGCKFQSYG